MQTDFPVHGFHADTLEDHHKYLEAFMWSHLNRYRCWGRYTVNDEMLVDKVYQFADGLPTMFDDLAIRLNIDRSDLIEYRTRQGFHDNRFTYKDLLDGEDSKFSKRIKNFFKKEIAEYGYEY